MKSGLTGGGAAPDGTADDDDGFGSSNMPWSEDPTSPSADDDGDTPPPQGSAKPSAPMQKRRRVTRACDECRRKKIKCDGKQPCTHCTVYSYECTYDQPSNRRRNPAPQYIEAIENRLHRAEALLKNFLPDVDLNDPNLGAGFSPSASSAGGLPTATTPTSSQFPNAVAGPTTSAGAAHDGTQRAAAPMAGASAGCADLEHDAMLESMVQHTGSLDLDDAGRWDFHGHSSGMVFLMRLRQQFGDLMGEAEGHGSALAPPRHFTPPSQNLDSSASPSSRSAHAADSPVVSEGASCISPLADLPSKTVARQYCESALDDALALMRFVHRPTFFAAFDRIFDVPLEAWGNEEHRNLPLVYAVMSVGTMFAKDENSKLLTEGYLSLAEQGYKFFHASKQLMDITECRDLPSLQAVICSIIFLQSTAKLSTCWSYVGIALHSAIRMGLHRSIAGNFNPIESEIRKRIFWQIRKMDIYVGAMLGLPTMLSDDDIDQEEPLDIDDECLTVERILPMKPETVPLMSATNAHLRLIRILQKIMRYIYPIKNTQHARNKAQSYVVSYAHIREIERDLQEWMENLPMSLRPGGPVPPRLERVQQLLRMSYAYLQMFLYRPFLHYVSKSQRHLVNDKRSYACAAACVSVSRNVIHITTEMSNRGLLIGAYWFVMYTTMLAIISLVFFVLENPDSTTCEELLKDAKRGKDVLASLARRSMAADRCTQTLTTLFSQLPHRLRSRPGALSTSSASKKRHAASRSPAPDRIRHATPPLPATGAQQEEDLAGPRRAATFPAKSTRPSSARSTQPQQNSQLPASTGMYRRASHETYSSPLENGPEADTDGLDNLKVPQLGLLSDGTSAPDDAGFDVSTASLPPTDPAAIADFSALMFPSPDPFAYPRQPMTSRLDPASAAAYPSGTVSAEPQPQQPPQPLSQAPQQPMQPPFYAEAAAVAQQGLGIPAGGAGGDNNSLLEGELLGLQPYFLPGAAMGGGGDASAASGGGGVDFGDQFGADGVSMGAGDVWNDMGGVDGFADWQSWGVPGQYVG